MPVVPTCGHWSSFGAWLSLSSLLGVRSHPFGVRWSAAGRRLRVVLLFARGYRVFRRWASFSAAGVICGGVGDVTWHAGDMEGARSVVDAGNVGVWLLGLVRRLSWFVGSLGCWSWWRLLVGGVVVEVVVVGWRQKAMSPFVMHVNLDQHSNARAHDHTLVPEFVVYITCIHYTVL